MSVDPRHEREQAALAEVDLFGSADYELRWPPQLVAYELAALRRGANARDRRERIEFLLEEAFLGETPAQDFAGAANRGRAVDDPWGDPAPAAVGEFKDADDYLDRLLAHLPAPAREPRARSVLAGPAWPAAGCLCSVDGGAAVRRLDRQLVPARVLRVDPAATVRG
jgi:hypothetical protein